MITISLPVLIIKNLILFPENELKIEVEHESMLKNISLAKDFHNGYLLVVSLHDDTSDMPDIKDLPKYGIVARVDKIITLPNGQKRITILGKKRAKVISYEEQGDTKLIDAIISKAEMANQDNLVVEMLRKKLIKNYNKLVNTSLSYSNELVDVLENSEELSKVTDILASTLSLKQDIKSKLLEDFNPVTRAETLLIELEKEISVSELELELEEKLKSSVERSQTEFILREKLKIIQTELGEVDDHERLLKKLNNRLNRIKAPLTVKKRIKDEITRYQIMNPNNPDYSIVYNYIELLLDLPWSKYTTDICDLVKIKHSLDDSHEGLDEIKTRILEYIAVKSANIKLNNPILCLVGPPGTGKTTLAMSIAKSLNRKFVKMSVGGLSDESEIFGHRKAYLGASPGKIITNIKKAKVNNPVFLIDEIDKLRSDFKGDPASALLDVLDPEQNHLFTDLYLDLSFNLNNIMFITTANYIEDIPEALRDRLEIITLSSYTLFEKINIAKNHVIPEVTSVYKLNDKLGFTDNAIKTIIEDYTYEAGVRKLTEKINKIARQIVIKNPDQKIIIDQDLEEYLGLATHPSDYYDFKPVVGTVNMLAVSGYGGVCFPVEVIKYPGTGKTILTGSIGKSMEESINVIISYLKSKASIYKINLELFQDNDIHIHGMLTDVPKDGASAGIAICTAIYSSLTNKVISHDIAMTGELSLNGDIIPIGGVKEKLIAAFNKGIKTVYMSIKNKPQVSKLPDEVKDNIKIVYVNHMDEIIKDLNKRKTTSK